jgi:small subunit ribosomal protein S3
MGHKVHPNGFRLGVYRNWESKWFATDKEFSALLLEDVKLRKMLFNRLKNAGVARIETERSSSALTITLHTAKPGIVIGKGGTSVDQLRDELEKMTKKRVRVTIQEIKKPELSAQLVAESVAAQLEKRIAFRRAVKQSLMKTMRAGAQGVKIRVKGRLGGSEMARIEWNREGRVPLHTLKADIDFGQTEAKTTFGRIGVSAWVYTGDFPTEQPKRIIEEPSDGEVPVAAALAETPLAAEVLGLPVPATPVLATPEPVAAPVAVAEPEPAPVAVVTPEGAAVRPARRRTTAPAAAPSDAAAAKPKRAPRAAKATTEDAAPKPKRTARAATTTAAKPAAKRTAKKKE